MARLDEEAETRARETLDARFAFFSASNFALIFECGTATNRRIKSMNFAFGSLLLELPLMRFETSA
jgi:hypothetical protein